MPGRPGMNRPKCRGTTALGQPCKRRAAPGSSKCAVHGGGTARVGAAPKLNQELIGKLAAAVATGVDQIVACQANGIHRSTLHGWLVRGTEDAAHGKPTIHADLLDAVTRARAEAEASLVALVKAHAVTDWRAAAFMLERRNAERWAKRDKVDVTLDEVSKPRVVDAADPDRRAVILSLLAAAQAAPGGQDE